jgi:rRNA-processing protein FCF1
MSDGEVLCEEIQRLLDDPQATPEQVSQKLDALRKEREKAGRQWVAAQQQLREVLDFRQQARLVLMGLLD